jgi:hypothetical protein
MEGNSTNRVPTTTAQNREAIRRFFNGEGGVVANQGRLTTFEADEDTTLLLSYTNEIIAEMTGDSDVHLYTGHYGQVSQATTNHIRQLGSVLSNTDGKEVTVSDGAPTMGVGSRASESAQYISNYVGNFANADRSPVEIDAMETVEKALQNRLRQLFR